MKKNIMYIFHTTRILFYFQNIFFFFNNVSVINELEYKPRT